jgi:hypothetical protein
MMGYPGLRCVLVGSGALLDPPGARSSQEVAPPAFSCFLLGLPGSPWLLLALPGSSWLFLAPPALR